MKIAIAALKKKENAGISDQAGRAPFYLLFDEKSELVEKISNPFSRGGGGAGFGVAKLLADMKVDLVVAGTFGEKMIGALEERGLRYREMSGTAGEAARRINAERQE